MDAAQLEARIIEARISNSFIQPSTHPLICKAIDAAQTHMKQYEAVNRTVVDKYVVELVKHPKANTPTLPFDDLIFVQGYWPAGGAISTVDDLLHYGQLLIDSYKGRPNGKYDSK